MKREDFREITEKHIESCKEIIRCNGVCADVNCKECPFDGLNDIEYNSCADKGYSTSGVNNTEEDKKLLQSAKEFLKLFKDDLEVDKMEMSKYKLNPLYVETKNQRVQCLIRPSTMQQIKKLAKKKEISTNEMINRILEDYISKSLEKFNLETELRRLEIKKFEYGKKNYYLYWNSTFEGIRIDCTTVADLPLTKYFSENKVLAEFNERIKEQKITKEEFFTAYKNVFGGR